MYMYRTAIIFAIAICVANATAESEAKSGLSIFGLDDSQEDESLLELEPSRTNGELGGVLLVIKEQFKEIIQDLALQALQYAKYVLHKLKVKLLTKLGMYTLKDIFHAVFDGVTDFVIEPSPEIEYVVQEEPKPVIDPSYFDGFNLASLFRAKRNLASTRDSIAISN